MHEVTCYRCGVDFDGSKFAPTAPCEDCQYDVPGNWTRGWPRGGRPVTEEAKQERLQMILEKWKQFKLDTEIAEELGISARTVLRYRKQYGIPAITMDQRPDMNNWKNVEDQAEHARNMVNLRKTVGRGSLGRFTSITGKTNGTLDYIAFQNRD